MKEQKYWNPTISGGASATECPSTGRLHEVEQIRIYVKNCDFFPFGHAERGHCSSCGSSRCKDCGDPRVWTFNGNGSR